MSNDFDQESQEKLLFDSIETMTSTEVDIAIKKTVNAVFLRQIQAFGGVVAVSFFLAAIVVVTTTKNAGIVEVALAVCFWLTCILIFLLVQRYFYQEKLKKKAKNARRNRSK